MSVGEERSSKLQQQLQSSSSSLAAQASKRRTVPPSSERLQLTPSAFLLLPSHLLPHPHTQRPTTNTQQQPKTNKQYVVVRQDGRLEWEPGENRCIHVPPAGLAAALAAAKQAVAAEEAAGGNGRRPLSPPGRRLSPAEIYELQVMRGFVLF